MEGMQAAVRQLLTGLGEDPTREGLLDTPKRVAKALLDASAGYHQTTAGVLGTAYFHEPIVSAGGEGLVVVRDIDFASTCQETLLPFHGRCHIGYVPANGVVLGLSKLARLTKMFAKRLQTQEQLGCQLTAALQRHLQPQGVAVVLQARHLDMVASIQPPQQTTACISGCFTSSDSSIFQEMLMMLGLDDIPPGSLQHCSSGSQPHQPSHVLTRSSSSSLEQGPVPPPTPDPSEHLSETTLSINGSVGARGASAAASAISESGGSQGARTAFSERSVSAKDVSELCSGSLSDPASDPESDPEQESEEREGGSDATQPRGCSCCGSEHDSRTAQRSRHAQQHVLLGPGPVQPLSEHCLAAVLHAPGLQLQAQQLMQDQQQEQQLQLVTACSVDDPRRGAAADAMEVAVQHLIRAMGECPSRPGLMASARRYVMTLLHATSGYARKLPAPLYPACALPAATSALQQSSVHHLQAAAQCPCCPPPSSSVLHSNISSHSSSSIHPGAPARQQHHSSSTSSGGVCRHARVAFNSQCEHHMLPFYGHVHVVYEVPGCQSEAEPAPAVVSSSSSGGSCGSSKGPQPALPAEAAAISQVVSMYTQRLQVQERITHQVADGVLHVLGGGFGAGAAVSPVSVLVLVDAAHMCMVARGVENHAGRTTSMALRGGAVGDAAWRARALQACRAAGLA